MRGFSHLFLSLVLLVFAGTPALAQNGDWTITETKGQVLVIDARGERAASAGQALAPGATVRTRAQSSAVLVRGREFVTLRQNAQLRIPEAARSRSIFQIIQDYGSAMFNIGKQPDPHFGVETPYLAAVVKGTTFIIAVSEEGATLQVTEGAVETSTRDGGARELVLPGAMAMVAAADPLRMVVEGETRRVIDSPARGAGGGGAAATPASASASAGATPASTRSERAIAEPIASSPADLRGSRAASPAARWQSSPPPWWPTTPPAARPPLSAGAAAVRGTTMAAARARATTARAMATAVPARAPAMMARPATATAAGPEAVAAMAQAAPVAARAIAGARETATAMGAAAPVTAFPAMATERATAGPGTGTALTTAMAAVSPAAGPGTATPGATATARRMTAATETAMAARGPAMATATATAMVTATATAMTAAARAAGMPGRSTSRRAT